MSAIDVVILACVVAVLALCVRSFARHKDGCADCASAGSCSASARAEGRCVATEDMLRRADAALSKAERGGGGRA
jgi:hypothetical protein